MQDGRAEQTAPFACQFIGDISGQTRLDKLQRQRQATRSSTHPLPSRYHSTQIIGRACSPIEAH